MDDRALQEYFRFDDADLMANRNGQFSDKQTKKLFEDPRSVSGRLKGCIGGLVGALLLLALAAMLAVPAISGGLTAVRQSEWVTAIFEIVVGGIWGLVWGSFALVALWGGISAALGLLPKILLNSVKGPVNLVGVRTSRKGRYSTQHELHIGGREFDVEERLANIITQGDVYAIYFIKDATILSVERLASS